LGTSILSFSAFLCVLIFGFSLQRKLHDLTKNLIYANLVTLFMGAIYLANQFLTDNFSFVYIFQNSNVLLPTFYKVSAFWAAHEGSFFLMIILLSSCAVINNLAMKESRHLSLSNSVIAFILFFYLIFLVLTSNPFMIFEAAPFTNGSDLNPLLQDPLLVIHPPMLFAGYVFYAITFSFVIAGVFTDFNKELFSVIKIWAGIAWFTLSLGILLGSMWAYYELGWGGYWFWDPVENVALMPWLAGTAFTHSLIFSKNKVLLSWMVFLGILTFLLSILGSFIVRSGILNSVHSFASDPSRGVFLLSLFALFSLVSLGIFFLRSNFLHSSWPNFMSKNYLLVLNNIILMTILTIVFLGTLYPIYYEVIYSEKFSVGPKYFSELITPTVFMLITLFTLEQFPKILSMDRLKVSLILIVGTAIIFIINYFNMGLLLSVIFLAILILKFVLDLLNNKSVRLHKLFGHLAVVLLTFSVLLNHEFSKNIDFKIKPNDKVKFMGTNLTFKSMDDVPNKENENKNFDSFVGTFEVEDKGKIFNITSEKRIYKVTGVITSETGIAPYITKDYLLVLGDRYKDGSWSVRYSIKYGIMMIWMSSFLLLFSILYGTIRRYDY
tara:strand:- start:845 stop:2668 length:1824 start_codon:yes stop_codon:yes gene_type:complete